MIMAIRPEAAGSPVFAGIRVYDAHHSRQATLGHRLPNHR